MLGGAFWVNPIRVLGVSDVLEPCPRMRVAAVDLGKVRVGLAVSDELGLIAHPRGPLPGANRKKLIGQLATLARAERVGRFLVGLPLDRSGGEGRAAARARTFAQALADATGRDVELVDERLSTVEATRRLREGGVSAKGGRRRVDAASAAILLQAWLDHGRGEPAR
jgi:putative pre-16S rRNA nuclease